MLTFGFTDVPEDGVHRRNIDKLAALGITTGATATQYQPQVQVRRDQMASFLARTANLLVAGRLVPPLG